MKINGAVELLAPANVNTLVAAVQGGADAVYLGGSDFGARQNAGNFEGELLTRAIDYCHLRGVKVYLTLNTIVGERELDCLAMLAQKASAEGIDAFIVQDFGVMNILKQVAPAVPLHASTQMTLHNTDGVKFAGEAGFKRAVLSRELSAKEIKEIIDKTDVEIEIFVHGALCMCYSGQCLMSSIIGGRSGNRGRCAQPCRLPYELYKGDKAVAKGYILSPKDLSLTGYIPQILDMGIKSLKIEGRMKGPEYVAASVSILRKCLDEKRNAAKAEVELLLNSFSRGGFTGGFFAGDKGKAMMRVEKGNDDIYENRNQKLLDNLKPIYQENSNLKKMPVDIAIAAKVGQPLKGELNFNDIHLDGEGEIVQAAQNKATQKDVVIRQISKTGDYPYDAQNIEAEIDNNVFLPVSEINSLRRMLLDKLQTQVIQSYKRENLNNKLNKNKFIKKAEEFFMAVQVKNAGQATAVLNFGAKYIFMPVELIDEVYYREDIIYVFPDIINNKNIQFYYNKITEMEKRNIKKLKTGNFAIIKKALECGFEVFGSSGLNIYNSIAANSWKKLGLAGAQLSVELNLSGARDTANTPLVTTVLAYGNIALMKIANCPVNLAAGKCDCLGCDDYRLKDRKAEFFQIIRDQMNCVTSVLNSKPVYMADRLDEIQKTGVNGYEIHFTTESPQECEYIINLYKTKAKFELPYTRGHFYRGV